MPARPSRLVEAVGIAADSGSAAIGGVINPGAGWNEAAFGVGPDRYLAHPVDGHGLFDHRGKEAHALRRDGGAEHRGVAHHIGLEGLGDYFQRQRCTASPQAESDPQLLPGEIDQAEAGLHGLEEGAEPGRGIEGMKRLGVPAGFLQTRVRFQMAGLSP